MFDRKSAAKTLHKPCRGFEYRYILYIDGNVYDRYTKKLVKVVQNKVTLVGINNKEYNIPIQKLIDSTFCDLDLTKFDQVKDHDGYLMLIGKEDLFIKYQLINIFRTLIITKLLTIQTGISSIIVSPILNGVRERKTKNELTTMV